MVEFFGDSVKLRNRHHVEHAFVARMRRMPPCWQSTDLQFGRLFHPFI